LIRRNRRKLALANHWVPHPFRAFCGMGGKAQTLNRFLDSRL